MMEEKKPTMNPEQAADFAALQVAANEADASAPAVPGAEPVPTVNLAADIGGAIKVAVATLSPMFPSLKRTYTDEVTEAAAGAIAAVCEKHGWMQGGMFAGYGEEVAAVAILAPLALTTYQGIQEDMAEAKAKQRAKLEPPAHVAVPGTMDASAKAVTFGAAVPVQEGATE